jgi:hypothetical protein
MKLVTGVKQWVQPLGANSNGVRVPRRIDLVGYCAWRRASRFHSDGIHRMIRHAIRETGWDGKGARQHLRRAATYGKLGLMSGPRPKAAWSETRPETLSETGKTIDFTALSHLSRMSQVKLGKYKLRRKIFVALIQARHVRHPRHELDVGANANRRAEGMAAQLTIPARLYDSASESSLLVDVVSESL